MTYQIITPADNADFFAQFKTFVVSVGWSIDAQSDSELYIHSGDKYLGFRIGNITYNTSSNAVFFTCAINTGYDNTKDWFNQPNSSVSNLDPSYFPMYSTNVCTRYLPCIYLVNDITQVVFIADLENIIINIKRGICRYDTIILTLLKKAYSFIGGDIISSSQILKGNSSNWFFNTSTISQGFFPFNSALVTDKTNLGGTCLHFNGTYTTSTGEKHFFLTNMMDDPTSVSYLKSIIPFNYYPEIYRIGSSMYTGLNPLVSPEFFSFKDNYISYLGAVEKIKVINRQNLVPEQILSYGSKNYIILEFIRGDAIHTSTDIVLTSYIAIEI